MDGLSYEETRTRRVSGGNELPDGLRPILRSLVHSNETLISQNKALLSLLSGTGGPSSLARHHQDDPIHFQPPSKASTFTNGDQHNENSAKWHQVLSKSARSTSDFADMFFDWPRPPTLAAVLSERRAWTSWSYKASFPQIATFLARAKRERKQERCPCQVIVEDISSLDEAPNTTILAKTSNRVDELWKGVSERNGPKVADGVSVRLWRIIDLSPVVLACLLGSTPQLDLSYVAAFTERHLKLSNWGKVSLLKFRDLTWSSYTFEYHFSFFYVTPDTHPATSQKPDKRHLRRSAPFGREFGNQTKFIHEEALSFLLTGHFNDISTSIQLAESYFKYDPYTRKLESHSFRQYNLSQSPSLMLLSWISVALHHVSWRWQSAIKAVDNELRFSGEVVFMEDRTDLMADDPQFSLSKTYFWALQCYQLFEKTLLKTIATWQGFKEHSLPSLHDGRVDQDEWNTCVEEIDDAIAELEAKVARIRTRIEEVKDLRTGLISASALFDSRTSVRQGENIRILTYITILFFPLSFVTSVFSMSFIGPNTTSAFAIALPAITLAAAVLVFNLQNIVTAWSVGTERSSGWLRHFMRRHRREGWKETAMKLHEDIVATKPPVTKARQQSSAWVYLLFLAEYLLVAVPVGELAAAVRWLKLVRDTRQEDDRLSIKLSAMLDEDDELANMARSKRIKAEETRNKLLGTLKLVEAEERKRRDRERGFVLTLLLRSVIGIWQAFKWSSVFILNFIRTLLTPIWLILIGIEYLLLALCLAMHSLVPQEKPEDDAFAFLPKDSMEPSQPSSWHLASQALGLETIFPPRQIDDKMEDDPEVMHIRRVKTQLSGVSTPNMSTISSPSPRVSPPQYKKPQDLVEVREVIENSERLSRVGGKEAKVRNENMVDMMRVPGSSNEVTRMVERGARFARSGLKPGLEVGSS